MRPLARLPCEFSIVPSAEVAGSTRKVASTIVFFVETLVVGILPHIADSFCIGPRIFPTTGRGGFIGLGVGVNDCGFLIWCRRWFGRRGVNFPPHNNYIRFFGSGGGDCGSVGMPSAKNKGRPIPAHPSGTPKRVSENVPHSRHMNHDVADRGTWAAVLHVL